VTDPVSPGWRRIAGAAVRRPLLVALASTAVLLALAAPLLGLRLGSPQLSTYDATGQAGAAATTATRVGIAPGALRPVEVLLPDPARTDDARRQLADLPGVAAAVAPTGDGWRTGDGQLLQVWTADDPATDAGAATVQRVRDAAAVDRGALRGSQIVAAPPRRLTSSAPSTPTPRTPSWRSSS
jgi:RND superfamily putative drug exporter